MLLRSLFATSQQIAKSDVTNVGMPLTQLSILAVLLCVMTAWQLEMASWKLNL